MNKYSLPVALLAVAAVCTAQVITSSLFGVVTDPSGAAVPSARITITADATGISASATADSGGEFSLTSLQAGRYTVQIEANGFQTLRRTGLDLASGARIRTAFQLEVGAVQS
ncbi:MAG: carboxypeptidase regulatory-like domain-containing protein, partial [Acidobacteria bacterium]|nr:carboxypeptidase regulatory-like domain-containing protein [Acidobacteriota bacterium]